METDTTFVRSNSCIELYTVTQVSLYITCIVYPSNTECENSVWLNDSLNDLGAKKDRHAVIGGGFIGLEAFARIVNHPALKGLPMVLETPNDLDGYGREIALLRQMEVA